MLQHVSLQHDGYLTEVSAPDDKAGIAYLPYRWRTAVLFLINPRRDE